MPSSLPDPVLALSMNSVQKLTDLNLDQLANLWNVFTKCKESLESGRRLENLSWRLWFREAHILPPDTSISDLTDFTPLDTPLISRANSIAGSYQHSRLPSAHTHPVAILSDPEDDSETSSEEDSESEINDILFQPQTSTSCHQKCVQTSATQQRQLPDTTSSFVLPLLATQKQDQCDESTTLAQVQRDRKRAISSSSAFGSKARVKQRNQSGSRRRPLSFQAAIENLDRNTQPDRFTSLLGKHPSMSQLDGNMGASTGALDAPKRKAGQQQDGTTARSSAPAEFSLNHPPLNYHTAKAATSCHPKRTNASLSALPFTLSESTLCPKMSRGASVSPAARSLATCHAPQTSGPTSPTKIKISTSPIIGTVSHKPLQGPSSSLGAAVSVADKLDQGHASDQARKLMPPPATVPSYGPAASAFKQNASHQNPAPTVDPLTNTHSDHIQQPGTRSIGSLANSENNHPQRSSPSAMMKSKEEATAAKTAHKALGHEAKNKAPKPLTTSHRSKSATGLHRANKNSKSYDRPPSRPGGHQRHASIFSGLTMTKAAPTASLHSVSNAAQTQSRDGAAVSSRPKKAPVKFTMGDDTESSDGEFEEHKTRPPCRDVNTTANDQQTVQGTVIDGTAAENEEDGWSSDSEDEEAERKARAAAEVERKRREEEEHQRTMFQKIPIRSKSAADLRLLTPDEPSVPGPSPPAQPVRGLLSSLFRPEEQHPPPGQLMGRPHASAADLRAKPGDKLPHVQNHTNAEKRSSRTRDVSGTSQGRGPPLGEGGLRSSKSAVALPLLDRSATRTSTSGKSKHGTSIGSHHSDEVGSLGSSGGRPSSVALARLHALTNMRQFSDREKRSTEGEVTSNLETETNSLRLEVSPDDRDFEQVKMAQKSALPPAIGNRSQSEGPRAPVAAPALARHRSNIHLPEAAAPQTPRTTRRNMLRDELSESLRQNLLWERQSRSRMLGIGAHVPRKDNVLNGGQLRPLTSTSGSSSNVAQDQGPPPKPKRYSEEWGSFHHKGW